MEAKRVIDLAREFADRLSEVAMEFSQYAAAVPSPSSSPSPHKAFDSVAKIALVTTLIEQRRLRQRFLPRQLFEEPAWDMLLVLYLCRHDKRVINVKALTSLVAAPHTTSQRWLDHLARLGLVDRATDTTDRRRVDVSLSDVGLSVLDDYLDGIM